MVARTWYFFLTCMLITVAFEESQIAARAYSEMAIVAMVATVYRVLIPGYVTGVHNL